MRENWIFSAVSFVLKNENVYYFSEPLNSVGNVRDKRPRSLTEPGLSSVSLSYLGLLLFTFASWKNLSRLNRRC